MDDSMTIVTEIRESGISKNYDISRYGTIRIYSKDSEDRSVGYYEEIDIDCNKVGWVINNDSIRSFGIKRESIDKHFDPYATKYKMLDALTKSFKEGGIACEKQVLGYFMTFKDIYNHFYKDDKGKYKPAWNKAGFKRYYKDLRMYMESLDFDEIEDAYTITKKLGEGAFGEVMMAEMAFKDCTKDDEKIKAACKSQKKSKNFLNTQYQAMKNETDLLSSLDHPCIVDFIFLQEDDEYFKAFYEYLPGTSLGDLFESSGGGLPHDTIMFFACELIIALQYLRDNKIVHRDIKPDNIMLNQFFHIKISDFGLAFSQKYDKGNYNKIVEQLGDLEQTYNKELEKGDAEDEDDDDLFSTEMLMESVKTSNAVKGTPAYMAPEMKSFGLGMHSSDVWALGCILYQFLTGKFVVEANSQKDIRAGNIDYSQIEDSEAQAFVKSCLNPNPFERFGGETQNLVEEAKKDPFFSDLPFEFEKVQYSTPPVPKFLISKINKKINEDFGE
jgi:3-phosphoinositide dependent protein kinase-1